MPRKQKDWYWEAEQDKIASDPDLKLLRSPEGCDGLPTEGFEYVGLWFLMFNLMAKSPRRGYLTDPIDNGKPMQTDALAVLTGRSVAVVSRLLQVILERRLFSKNEQEIIYSRGMVAKEQLRKKRSKSGKKGGLRTQDLLKQVVQQKGEQNVSIGIGIETPPNSTSCGDFAQANGKAKFSEAAERLSFLYRSNLKGRRPEDLTICAEAFEEMMAMGLSEATLTAHLKLSPPARDRGEFIWEIKKKFFPKSGGKGGISEGVQSAFEWATQGEGK